MKAVLVQLVFKMSIFTVKKVQSIVIDGIKISNKNNPEKLLKMGEIYYFIYLLIKSGINELSLIKKVEKEFNRTDFTIDSFISKNDFEEYLSPTRILGNLPNFNFTN